MIHALGWPMFLVLFVYVWFVAGYVGWLGYRAWAQHRLQREIKRRSARVLRLISEEKP